MRAKQLVAGLAVLLLGACGKAQPADPAKPGSYAVRLVAQPAAGDPLQRLALAPAALVAVESAGMADIRVFDAKGRAMPAALLGADVQARQTSLKLDVFPIIGSAAALKLSGIALTIDEGRIAHITGIEPARSGNEIVAALIDTRRLAEPAITLNLGADLPKQQPVTFTLESSADLKSWEPLAEKVLFRPGEAAGGSGAERIALPSADLQGRYVRVSWSSDAPLVLPVRITGAVVTVSKLGAAQRITVPTTGLTQTGPHELRFALPLKQPIAGLRISQTGQDGVVPIRLFARNDAVAPWLLLAAGTVRQGHEGSANLEVTGPAMASYRIEADQRTAGFSAVPKLDLLLNPAELLVQFSGTPPYILAAGLTAAPGAYLTPQEIAPGAANRLAGLPRARVIGGAAPLVSLEPAADGGLMGKRMTLWLVLLAGVAVLGLALARLLKGNAAKGADLV